MKLKTLVIRTRERVLPWGSAEHATVVPARFSQVTLISDGMVVTPDPRDSAMIAQPILFDDARNGQAPVYEEGSRAATRAPARAWFSTVIWA